MKNYQWLLMLLGLFVFIMLWWYGWFTFIGIKGKECRKPHTRLKEGNPVCDTCIGDYEYGKCWSDWE